MSLGKGLALAAPWIAAAVVGASIGGESGAKAAVIISLSAVAFTLVVILIGVDNKNPL